MRMKVETMLMQDETSYRFFDVGRIKISLREEWLNIVGLKLEMHAKIELNADEMLEKVLD